MKKVLIVLVLGMTLMSCSSDDSINESSTLLNHVIEKGIWEAPAWYMETGVLYMDFKSQYNAMYIYKDGDCYVEYQSVIIMDELIESTYSKALYNTTSDGAIVLVEWTRSGDNSFNVRAKEEDNEWTDYVYYTFISSSVPICN